MILDYAYIFLWVCVGIFFLSLALFIIASVFIGI